MKPTVGGMPASENMNTDMTPASQGLRRASPAKSAMRSNSWPSRASSISRPNTPSVVST